MRHLWMLLATLSAPAIAQSNDLPPEAIVASALDNQPTVAAAMARIDAARAESHALRRGSHEITAQGTLSRRTIEREGDHTEFDTTISRAFRLPGKAALDRSSGALAVTVATDLMEDARHQAALALAQLWYDWLRAADLHRNALALVTNQRTLVQATGRRVALRDAAQLDLEQANVALALAETQAGDAAADRDRARALLAARFPDLPLPADPPSLADPAIPAEGFARLQALIVERSHEIGAAAGQADRRAVMARRARSDRMADPSLGFRLFSERGGEEKGAGLFASLPLGGGHRRALADQAAAEATAARADQMQVEREIASNAAADVAEAQGRLNAWRASREAVRRAEESAALSARGQSLGAIDLADRLYAERQANETRAAEIAARAAAARVILKLRIDAHTLWINE
ncbi:TolC family protein [Sphingomonas colocasiae]|uniref:TolC family protein n=1 Tax=Sphingomonas colocasiae TaxID=1848973 RepID=A0ABS7PUT9_9SPHN|nr:TolC family protein [Sphingomonas colocasiae]MBY8824430.1 TolC family protein [Sphingomonas colocasiae]